VSSVDTDLFAPIGSPGPAPNKPEPEEQIEQLFQMLNAMAAGQEITLNFDQHNTRFQLRMIGKYQ
jgi:hypothetical protein